MSERLQKLLASSGIGSRRQVEELIRQGRLTVNNIPAQLGIRINGDDQIKIDGKKLNLNQQKCMILAYHKPVGEITTRHDTMWRPTVFKSLPILQSGRWVVVGRLDINTQGLLLFTTDGELANRLMHPKYRVEREYAVRVLGPLSQGNIQRLLSGIVLEGRLARFDRIIKVGGNGINNWYQVILHEGRNRIVRRLLASQGFLVSRLIRVRYGTVVLRRDLHPGCWEKLDRIQVYKLLASVGYDIISHQARDRELVSGICSQYLSSDASTIWSE